MATSRRCARRTARWAGPSPATGAAARCCTRPPRRPTRPAARRWWRTRRSCRLKNSARIVLCSRSTFPVVVGERGAVSRCRIPFSAQIRSNSTGRRPGPEPAGEHLPVVGQDLLRHPMPAQRLAAARHTPVGRSPAPPRCADTTNREWSSIPVTTFTSVAVGEVDPAHHVHLPQLHRPAPLPPPVVRPAPPPLGLGVDQPMAHQRPIDRRPAPAPDRPPPGPADERIRCRTPPRMLPAASPPPAPRPPPASDADTTTAATTDQPGSPAHRRRHTGATTRAPSAGSPRYRRATSSPTPRPAPRAPPDTAAPPRPAPPAPPAPPPPRSRTTTREEHRKQDQHRRCHPPTGTPVAQLPEPRPEPSPRNRNRRVKHEPDSHTE